MIVIGDGDKFALRVICLTAAVVFCERVVYTCLISRGRWGGVAGDRSTRLKVSKKSFTSGTQAAPPDVHKLCGVVKALFDERDVLLNLFVRLNFQSDLGVRVHGGGVVSPTQLMTDQGIGTTQLFTQ